MSDKKITALRLERLFFTRKATESEYLALYRDTQPGQNVYWNGFGDPPSITHRADFNDIEFNRVRQSKRQLVKGRFQGGNLGWICVEDMELFACMCKKPLDKPTIRHTKIFDIIEREGPVTIQQIKEITGYLVKEITPVLHRLQEAFMIYEDQHDGEWDRGWYKFPEMFPEINLERYTRVEALKIVLQKFAYRHVLFDADMAKSFYKLPIKDIKTAIEELLAENVIIPHESGYILKSDERILENYEKIPPKSVFALHKNDFLYRSNEHILKDKYKRDVETLYYLMIDGEICGAAYGLFRFGPPDFVDLRVDLSDAITRKEEIIEAVKILSYDKLPEKFNGEEI